MESRDKGLDAENETHPNLDKVYEQDAKSLTREEKIAKIKRLIKELNEDHERRSKKLEQQMSRLEEVQETFDWFLMK